MPLFQNSVLNKYLKGLEKEKVAQAYQRFSAHFHNSTIQENIRNSKEEQYQGEFLIDFFVKVLGYVKNPAPEFNLTTEFKNVKDNKKADGAILKNDSAVAVIELKGTETTDLGKIETQAFGYKNNQPGCTYVITSNFEKLRFYIENVVDFEEFNLFQLTKKSFEVLWLCLSVDSLLKDLPKKIKEESLIQEEQVTKKLYKDYSDFRTAVFRNISEANPQFDKLMLFKKTQKLLDRFLFIFFAEDRLLLPPNSIRKIIQQWTDLSEKYDEYFPLYERFKKYFGYLNTGHKGKEHNIFAYNGGLFEPDEILDNIEIDDNLLYEHTQNLSNYDFESEVSVNILGHIFEHSLTEIENIQAELEGLAIDKSKTKRKKDGVFYTPKYITKYIVNNTVGKLCEEKKIELDITDEAYQPAKQRSRQKLQKLQEYRDWLLQLTICDPACGSGAFLNQSLEFLIAEHHYIDELSAKYNKDALMLSDVENSILENNLFGVDINEESVEIAKLSLWLRTAQKGRKLTSLSDNIKCGNSLIDDPEVAGDSAFDWQKEFPPVFGKGGFDVVIGNPPYVRQEMISPFKPYFANRFKTYHSSADLYTYFIELSIKELLNADGIYSIIVGNKWMRSNYGESLRSWLKSKNILEIIDFGDLDVFKNVAAYPCVITIDKNEDKDSFWVAELKDLLFDDLGYLVKNTRFTVKKSSLQDSGWNFVDEKTYKLIQKIEAQGDSLEKVVEGKIYRGLLTGLNEAFIINRETKDALIKNNPDCSEMIKPFLAGRDIKRYAIDFKDTFIILIPCGWTDENRENQDPWEFFNNKFPAIANHLVQFEEKAKKRYDKGDYWWELRACAYYDQFKKPKILLPDISLTANTAFDNQGLYYLVNTAYIIVSSDRSLTAKINSKLLNFYYKNISPSIRGGYLRFIYQYLAKLPIVNDEKLDPAMKNNSDKMHQLAKLSAKTCNSLIKLLQSKFSVEKPSKKLQNWHELDFGEFLKELRKHKVQMSLAEEAEWLTYFNEQKTKVQELQTQIDQTYREIDQMVYELYGLNQEEIAIVENS